jgi:hypothetical protein
VERRKRSLFGYYLNFMFMVKIPVEFWIECEVLKIYGEFEGESRTSLVTSLLSFRGRGVVWVLLNPLM